MASESEPSRPRMTPRRLLIAAVLMIAIAIPLAIMRATNEEKPAAATQPAEKETEQARAEVARVFDRAVREHTQAVGELAALKPGVEVFYKRSMDFKSWGLGPYYSGGRPTLNRSAAMEDLTAKCLAAREKGLATRVRACVEAAGKYLAHKDAAYRTVACEFLAWFPQYAVESDLTPAVGALLGDQTAAFEGASFNQGQRDTSITITRIAGGVRVSDVARRALARMTTFRFAGPEVFRPWWGRNKEYRRRLWYWSLRWRHMMPGRERAALADLDGFRPAEALRLLLLAGNDGAKLADCGLPPAAGRRGTQSWPVREQFSNCAQFSPETTAGFVRKHKLKGVLIRILHQNPPWPEARGAGAMRDLLYTVVPILPLALDKSDVDLVVAETMAKDPRGAPARNGEILVDLVKAAIRLDPKRAEGILVDQLKREPRWSPIAAELVRWTGLKHWDMIQAACPEGGSRQNVIGVLAELRTPQAAAALAQWLAEEDWTPKLNEYGHETDSGRDSLFEAFIKAAAVLNGGKDVIAQGHLERTRWKWSKGLTLDQILAANKPVPAARAEAIVQLEKFFARAAEQPATQPAVRSADRVKKLKANLATFYLELTRMERLGIGQTWILTTKPLPEKTPQPGEFFRTWNVSDPGLPDSAVPAAPPPTLTVRISEKLAGEIIDYLANDGFFARAKPAEGDVRLKPSTVHLLAGTSGHDYLCYEVLNEARAKTLSDYVRRAHDKAIIVRDAKVAAARDALIRKAIALQPSKGRIDRKSDQNPTCLDFSDVLKWSGRKSFVERFTKAPKPYDEKIEELTNSSPEEWALCVLLNHPNIDVKIRAARALGASRYLLADAVPALLAAAKSNNYRVVRGSENVTVHNVYRRTLKKALERHTGETLTVLHAEADPARVEFRKVESWLMDVLLSWEPGVMRELAGRGPGKKCYLDLDTGKVYAEPNGLADEKARGAWCAKRGIDLICEKSTMHMPGGPGLAFVGVNLQTAKGGSRRDGVSERWFDLRASHARTRLAKVAPSRRAVPFPTAFVFKTRAGRIGQLQCKGATDDTLKFHYRLVRTKTATAQPATQPADKADGVAKWFDKRLADIARGMVFRQADNASVDPTLTKASTAELARRIRDERGPGDWAPLTEFVARTADKPQLRAKLAGEIIVRIEALRKKGKWSICVYRESQALLSTLIALKARRELLGLMAGEITVNTCCGSDRLMLAIVAMGRAEDAWPILRHFAKSEAEGWSSYFNGCMMRLTGEKTIPLGAIRFKSDEDDKAFRNRAVKAWAKRLVTARIGLKNMTAADRVLASTKTSAPSPEAQAIAKHIRTIHTNPSTKAKTAASWALAGIGMPALKPLMDDLHQRAEAKPGDKVWISPGYIQRIISDVCKRVGPDAERAIIRRFARTTNATERKLLFDALVGGVVGFPKILAHLLGVIRADGKLDGNARWGVRQVVHHQLYDGWGRDETTISILLGVFGKYPDLEKKYLDIRRSMTILKTVGAPRKETTFSPVIHRPLSIVVDEQTEFFIALPKLGGATYHWGVGKGRKGDINWRAHGLLYLGLVFGKGTVHYYRFLAVRPLKTPLNAHVQGGVPDNDPAEYPMTLTVRALSPEKKVKRFRELRSSLDEQKRKYATRQSKLSLGQRAFKDAIIFVDNPVSGATNGASGNLISQGRVACGDPRMRAYGCIRGQALNIKFIHGQTVAQLNGVAPRHVKAAPGRRTPNYSSALVVVVPASLFELCRTGAVSGNLPCFPCLPR